MDDILSCNPNFDLKYSFSLLVSDDVTVNGIKKISCSNFLIRMFLSLFAVFKINCFEENCFCIVFRMTSERKHNEVTLKTKYEILKEFDKNGPNKEVII